jgi:hypothetical protein
LNPLRFFVQLAIGVAFFWSVVAAVSAVDPGAAYRAQQFLQSVSEVAPDARHPS